MIDRDRIAASIDIPRAEREVLRWTILVALWHARPYGADEILLLNAARDAMLRTTEAQLRAEMNSLRLHGLIHLHTDKPVWWAEISGQGEAVVEYRADPPAGVFRPPRW